MKLETQIKILFSLAILTPLAVSATFSNLEVHLDDHNADILLEGENEFDSLELYDKAVEIDGQNTTIKSNEPNSFNSTITEYNVTGSNTVIQVETSANTGAIVDYSFDGPDGEYLIERDGAELETKTAHENLYWSNEFDSNNHQFTVTELIERKVWSQELSPKEYNTDPIGLNLQTNAFASITDEVNVSFHQANGDIIQSEIVENSSTASTLLDLDPQNEYTGYVNISDGKISNTEDFNFSTISLELSWNDTSNLEDGFIIESNHTTEQPDEYRELYDLPQDTEQKRVTHPQLEFNQTVCFKIKAYNVGGISEPVEKCKDTPEAPLQRPWE